MEGIGRGLINVHPSIWLERRARTRKTSVRLANVPRVIRVAMQMKFSLKLQNTSRGQYMTAKFQQIEEPHKRVTWGRNVLLKTERLK
jgi:hypothetical protein